jgi:hypothetical protein
MSASRSGLWGRSGVVGSVVVLLFASMVGLALAATLPPGGTFSDDDGNIHEASIEAIAAEGITRGCNPPINDLYCPSETVSRGQMAAFLVRALSLTDRLDDPFTDDDGSVFEADVEKLAAAGITRGCNPPDNTLFCPNDPVTRGQMAAFLVRAMGYTDAGDGDLFVDDDGSVFEADIDRLGTAEVTRGCNPPDNDMFCPNDLVLRDQMASFLTRALGLTPIAPPPPTSSTTTTTSGTTPTTLPPVGPEATFTACGDDTVGDEFSLQEQCVAATVYNSTWAQASYPDVISYLWLDPDGDPVSTCPVSGNCTAVDYHYVGGFLVGWTFYFYVDGEDRDPGWHSLEMWSGVTGDKFQTLLLRDHFELSDIDPIPGPEPKPTVSWECSNNPDGSRTCTGNTDTLDAAAETWTCTPVPDTVYPVQDDPNWDCSGDIDKRTPGDESWFCLDYLDCSGNVDTSDAVEETWETSWDFMGSHSNGDIDRSDDGGESWECDKTATGLSCSAEWRPWEWICTGDYRADWSCSGSVGRLAPIVGPVPMDEGEW